MNSMDDDLNKAGSQDIVEQAEIAIKEIEKVRNSISNVIYGQRDVMDQVLITIFSGGHALLVGLPGLAKTKLVETMGTVLGLSEQRVQFTPDLMPSDIIGSEIMHQDENGKRSFQFVKGPVFTQLLMADEINRASPRTQAALLQSMQEYHVTIAGKSYDLPSPFHVLATQNPLEQEGTYPLPEAQLDRFLLQIDVHYPDFDAERRILLETTGNELPSAKPVLSSARVKEIQSLVRLMPVGESVIKAILTLVRSARPDAENAQNLVSEQARKMHDFISWGPGPRASQALMLATRARALLDGRLAPNVDDVIALATPALQHRMQLSFAARAEAMTLPDVISNLKQTIG